ncbi:MAG: hypothetical protein AAF696_12425 [Bacteroidota bacterium]
MKNHLLFILLLLPLFLFGQRQVSMEEVEGSRELSMAETKGMRSNGMYRYYAKGERKAFTGILYAKYDNGNYLSRQEYVDGIGEGKWINYYENGNIKEVGYYKQNLVEGPIEKYYQNGQLKAKGTYKDWRIRIGQWEYYDEKGNLTERKDYGEKGSIEEVKAYYKRGDISYSWYKQILSDNGFE